MLSSHILSSHIMQSWYKVHLQTLTYGILFCPQTMTDVVGNPEEERRADYYYQPWSQEAVCRYFYSKVGTRSKLPTYVQVLASTARLVYRNCYSIKPCMGPYIYSKVIPKGCPMQRICYFSKLFLCIAWSLLLHGQLMANLTLHLRDLKTVS